MRCSHRTPGTLRALIVGTMALPFSTVSAGATTNVMCNGQFETFETTGDGWPTDYCDWAGDKTEIVSTTMGISPRSGERMLQFHFSDKDEANAGDTSELVLLIDLSPFQPEFTVETKNRVF